MQVASPAQKLASWRNSVREHPLDLYIGKRRVVHTGNWLINVSLPLQAWMLLHFHKSNAPVVMHRRCNRDSNSAPVRFVDDHASVTWMAFTPVHAVLLDGNLIWKCRAAHTKGMLCTRQM